MYPNMPKPPKYRNARNDPKPSRRRAKKGSKRTLSALLAQIHTYNKYLLSQAKKGLSRACQALKKCNWSAVTAMLMVYVIVRVEGIHDKMDFFNEALSNTFVTLFVNLVHFSQKLDWLLELFTGSAS